MMSVVFLQAGFTVSVQCSEIDVNKKSKSKYPGIKTNINCGNSHFTVGIITFLDPG